MCVVCVCGARRFAKSARIIAYFAFTISVGCWTLMVGFVLLLIGEDSGKLIGNSQATAQIGVFLINVGLVASATRFEGVSHGTFIANVKLAVLFCHARATGIQWLSLQVLPKRSGQTPKENEREGQQGDSSYLFCRVECESDLKH